MTDESVGCDRVDIGPLGIDPIHEAECIARVLRALDEGRGGWILTANLNHLALARRNPSYAQTCGTASLILADGMPLVWASRLSGNPVPGRVAGSDLIVSLTRALSASAHGIFLLGGRPGVAERAAPLLAASAPEPVEVRTDCPPMGFSPRSPDWAATVEKIRAAAPSVVYLGLSSPRQEEVALALCRALPRAWIVTVGISFSFLVGDVRRAPRWMQRSGLEWIHRLAQEPRRLARRYLLENSREAARLFLWAARARRSR